MFQKAYQKLQTREGITLVASLALVGLIILMLIFGLRTLFAHRPLQNEGTLVVTGKGEVVAVPDIATFTYMVSQEKKTMAEAQTASSEVAHRINEKLQSSGVLEKDITMQGFNANPTYTYPQPCYDQACPVSQPKISGYAVSQSYTIKVRDLNKASDIAQILTDTGASSVSGPRFEIDNQDEIHNDARDKAIGDAREQAYLLAQQLGVRLGKIIDFQVAGNGNYPMPMYASMDRATAGSPMEKSVAPDIQPGESTVSSQVTITYNIR